MGAFNAWPTILMPATPAPKSVTISPVSLVGISLNPFSGQMQTQDWSAGWMELTVTMPTMALLTATPWFNFLVACRGTASVFQIANPTWWSLIPPSANVNGYWRLKTNSPKWSINDGLVVGMEFEIREAT